MSQFKKFSVHIDGKPYNYQMNLRAMQLAAKRMKMSMRKLLTTLEKSDPLENPRPYILFCYSVLLANNGNFEQQMSFSEFEEYFVNNPDLMEQINQAQTYNMSLN